MPTNHLFIYPNYGTPDLYPELTQHSGQYCTVVRELGEKEDVDVYNCGPMFTVRFGDNATAIALADELTPEPEHPWIWNAINEVYEEVTE